MKPTRQNPFVALVRRGVWFIDFGKGKRIELAIPDKQEAIRYAKAIYDANH